MKSILHHVYIGENRLCNSFEIYENIESIESLWNSFENVESI